MYRPFTTEPVYGDIYMYFLSNGRRTENLFLGVVTKKGKQGHWVRYWDNGNKRTKDFILTLKKMVYGLSGRKMDLNLQKSFMKMV